MISVRKLFHAGRRVPALLLLAAVGVVTPVAQAADSKVTLDRRGDVGSDSSIVLDPTGRPVISYCDGSSGDLKVLRCLGKEDCRGKKSIEVVDSIGQVGAYSSLALDFTTPGCETLGCPVVSYYDTGNMDLKILHCNDPNCDNGDDSIESPDTAGNVGMFTSLALDSLGNPVVSYYDATNGALKVMHCDDPNCAGGGESIESPDATSNPGMYTSLALDSSGFPVISYHFMAQNGSNGLRVMHCNDEDCAGGDESIQTKDGLVFGSVGIDTSLVLDALERPVVAYNFQNSTVKILHCDDPDCAPGGDSIQSPDSSGPSLGGISLALDSNGFPIISYGKNGELIVLRCNDANCADADESIVTAGSKSGPFTAITLDSLGYPVVSHHDSGKDDLKLLYCDDPFCAK